MHKLLRREAKLNCEPNDVFTLSNNNTDHFNHSSFLSQRLQTRVTMVDDSIELVAFDDGHSPGATSVETKLAVYKNKRSTNFFSIYDNVLPGCWCDRAYQYAVDRKKRHLIT